MSASAANSLEGGSLLDTLAQRQQANAADQRQGARVLEVYLASIVAVVALEDKPAEDAERHIVFEFVPVHLTKERPIVADQTGDDMSQLTGEFSLAPHRLEVEEDVGEANGNETALARPPTDLIDPLPQCLTPQRIYRHAVAIAVGDAGLVQVAAEPLGQLEKKGIGSGVLVLGVIGDDEAVILVGKQVVLAATSRAHDDGSGGGWRITPTLRGHLLQRRFADTAIQIIVDVTKKLLDFRRGEMIGEELGEEFHLRRLDLPQACAWAFRGEAVDLPHQSLRRRGQSVVQVEDADE